MSTIPALMQQFKQEVTMTTQFNIANQVLNFKNKKQKFKYNTANDKP